MDSYEVKELETLKRVPEWLKNKIDKFYVQSDVWKNGKGIVNLEIRVGGRSVVRLESKENPQTENEWQRLSDMLELNHYMNWMRRFVKNVSDIEDEHTREAVARSDKPREGEIMGKEENYTKRSERVWCVVERVMDYVFVYPKTWYGKVLYYAIPIAIGYCVNRFLLKIGI